MRYLLPLFLLAATPALADPRTDCPDSLPCKVMVITGEEEKILLNERGILATAAQARSLDLAGLVTYFQQKITKAPAGDIKEPPAIAEKPASPANTPR